MQIAVSSDHAGFELKQIVADHLRSTNHQVVDLGTDGTTSVDYPDFGRAVGLAVVGKADAAAGAAGVVTGKVDLGIAVCGSGIGICIAANKVAGVRAATVHDVTSARLSREHNDANVMCLGARFVGVQIALDAVDAFVATQFAGGRHGRRVEKLNKPIEEF